MQLISSFATTVSKTIADLALNVWHAVDRQDRVGALVDVYRLLHLDLIDRFGAFVWNS